jgi:DNA-directed RNA polymerase subunit beta
MANGQDCHVKVFTRGNGEELPPGDNNSAGTHCAKRKISEGDKMAGRHGNKGVVSRIMPREDMPFLPNGQPVQVVLNPLGVPSRMNIGQILEAHLGWAACSLGLKIEAMEPGLSEKLQSYDYDTDKLGMPQVIEHAVKMAVPVFDGAHEQDLKNTLALAELDPSGKTVLYDGRTGEPFDNKVTVGYVYMLKHQQLLMTRNMPVHPGPSHCYGSRPTEASQIRGQRFGEMEVLGAGSFGAA